MKFSRLSSQEQETDTSLCQDFWAVRRVTHAVLSLVLRGRVETKSSDPLSGRISINTVTNKTSECVSVSKAIQAQRNGTRISCGTAMTGFGRRPTQIFQLQ